MPFRLPPVAELEKNFEITDVEGFPEIDEADPIKGSFRQATEEEDLQRDRFVNVIVKYSFNAEGVIDGESRKPKTGSERRAYEVFLTLSSIDIADENNRPLFKFSDINGLRKVAGKWENFQKLWGRLPKAVSTAVHAECVNTNPDWGLAWVLPDEDGTELDDPEGEV